MLFLTVIVTVFSAEQSAKQRYPPDIVTAGVEVIDRRESRPGRRESAEDGDDNSQAEGGGVQPAEWGGRAFRGDFINVH